MRLIAGCRALLNSPCLILSAAKDLAVGWLHSPEILRCAQDDTHRLESHAPLRMSYQSAYPRWL